ncbi:MAG TPA: helix-turn-helix domain-containing protein [Chitinophagales bacterium]|nr:helix-turn-helix domain-containing protein [Chitinophagales bacterium]
MEENSLILDKLTQIAEKLNEQNMLQKTVLNFMEACEYLDLSQSHLYKLTSARHIPHFCPQGKKLYFRRDELDIWLQRNRQLTNDELEDAAVENFTRVRRANNLSNSKSK